MKMNDITIISFYDYFPLNENRVSSVAAINKINYIAKSLTKINYKVLIFSPSWTNDKKFHLGKTITLEEGIKLKYIFSLPWCSIFKIVNIMLSNIFLLYFMLFKLKKNSNVIVYHSMYLIRPLLLIKKIKKFNLILEIEEIYQDVHNFSKRLSNYEYQLFFAADKYIFVNKLLNAKINIKNKPYCISHGAYNIEKQLVKKYTDGKIHVVYSGIIDSIKKGAFVAVEATKYLDERFELHVIGFGNNNDIKSLIQLIEKLNKTNKCKIVYDGLKTGIDYIKYIQKCDIGLSTQDPNAKYNDSSFPSKIIAYLSNGLRVVTIDIPAIRTSNISSAVYFYKKNNPKEIANVINNINLTEEYDSRKLIKNIDNKFCSKLKEMLK